MKRRDAYLLLVEPDENLGQLLRGYFQAKQYHVDLFTLAEEAYDALRTRQYDIVLTELSLPDDDGFTFIQTLRQRQLELPIIIASSRNSKDDVVRAFESGTDDFVPKPFNIEELILRMEALLRRSNFSTLPEDTRTVFQIGSFEFDVIRQVLTREGHEVRLTTKETDLLRQLAIRGNDLLTREHALKTVWAESSYFNARSMDVYITRLRKLLKDDPNVKIINVRGRGFKLVY